jgi:hypothetical protein
VALESVQSWAKISLLGEKLMLVKTGFCFFFSVQNGPLVFLGSKRNVGFEWRRIFFSGKNG